MIVLLAILYLPYFYVTLMLDLHQQSGGLEKKLQFRDTFTTVHGFHQLIPQPTHQLPQTASCIDLIFRDQPYLIVQSVVHPSLH